MSSVDIHSVQSISVLKDASATAVYGVKGANGVILITTKRGTEGKAKISASASSAVKFVSKLPETYGSADALYYVNKAVKHELGLEPASWGNIIDAAEIFLLWVIECHGKFHDDELPTAKAEHLEEMSLKEVGEWWEELQEDFRRLRQNHQDYLR